MGKDVIQYLIRDGSLASATARVTIDETIIYYSGRRQTRTVVSSKITTSESEEWYEFAEFVAKSLNAVRGKRRPALLRFLSFVGHSLGPPEGADLDERKHKYAYTTRARITVRSADGEIRHGVLEDTWEELAD